VAVNVSPGRFALGQANAFAVACGFSCDSDQRQIKIVS